METALTIVVIAAAVVAFTALAERIKFSAPLLLMLLGICVSFVPFIHEPQLSAEVVLIGFLPPLLYAAAIRTSVIDFRVNRRAILQLSVVLVVVTALGIGLITWAILRVPFPVAFALGAVVAPPDAVAATSIARRIGMPRRLVTILEGESLINDATAITCLRVAILAMSGAVSGFEVAGGFAIAAIGGAAVGFAIGALAIVIRRRITQPSFDTAISLIIPWAAYLAAEELGYGSFHGSGVIAVVVAGLMLGHKSPVIQSGQSRLSERINWSTIQFLLENAVFLLIGLQARHIVLAVGDSELGLTRILGFCLAILAGVIVIRVLALLASRATLFRRNPSSSTGQPRLADTFVVGWAGLRGVVTLAAAYLIPPETQHLEVLVLGAMVVTAGTLLLQGLTLPILVRRLGLHGPDARADTLAAATVLQTTTSAALANFDLVRQPGDSEESVQAVRDRMTLRVNSLWERLGDTGVETPAAEYRRIRLQVLQLERDEVLKIRSGGTVDHEVIEEVLNSLDVEESMLTAAGERADRVNEVPLVGAGQGEDECDHLLAAPHADTVGFEPVRPNSAGGNDLPQSDVLKSGVLQSGVCEDCVREDTRPVHLRICLTCGNIGCCDSSSGRHAERHFRTTGHAVMRSYEPGEKWRWCYLDEQVG